MTKPGDPFDTPELDRLRSRQRRDLAAIDEVLVSGASSRSIAEPDGMTELALRAKAEARRASLGSLPDQLLDAAKAQALATFLDQRVDDRSSDEHLEELALGAANARLAMRSDLVGVDYGTFVQWVHLLVWSDEVADDGYRDSRLPKGVAD